MSQKILIPSRFSGPPNLANGGYAAGCFADQIDAQIAVRLLKPVPLETDLHVRDEPDGSWALTTDDARIATATRRTVEGSAPEAPPYAIACEASRHYPGSSSPRFAACFVCGPQRALGDGLRIFPGVVPGTDMVAAPWRPDPSLADAQGRVRPAFVWAALDCPGYFATFRDGRYALLGELAVRIDAPVEAGVPHVVIGWSIAEEGRKRRAGTALLNPMGQCVAQGVATWIEVASA